MVGRNGSQSGSCDRYDARSPCSRPMKTSATMRAPTGPSRSPSARRRPRAARRTTSGVRSSSRCGCRCRRGRALRQHRQAHRLGDPLPRGQREGEVPQQVALGQRGGLVLGSGLATTEPGSLNSAVDSVGVDLLVRARVAVAEIEERRPVDESARRPPPARQVVRVGRARTASA